MIDDMLRQNWSTLHTLSTGSLDTASMQPYRPKLTRGPSSYHLKDGDDEAEVGQMILWASK